MRKSGENIDKKQTKLAGLEEKIYSKDHPVIFRDTRSIIHDNLDTTTTKWDELKSDDQEKIIKISEINESSFFSKFTHIVFYVSSLLFLIAVIFSAYHFYFNKDAINKNKIGINMETPSYIDAGLEFPVDIYITNENRGTLERVDIILEYPKGESITSVEDTVVKRISIGNVEYKKTVKGTDYIILYGREGSIRNIKAYIEYYAPGSSVVQKKDITKTISFQSALIVMTVDSLKEVTSNQDTSITINIKAERGIDIKNLITQVTYPNGFTYIKAEPEPKNGNNTWGFDSILKGQTQKITIYGKLRGEDGDEKTFRVSSGADNIFNPGVVGVVFADTKTVVSIKKPFIGLTGSFESTAKTDTGEYAILPANRTIGVFEYRNNVEDTISNVVVTARLNGEMINRSKITVNGGYFDSSKNLIIWDQTTNGNLKQILPGDSGQLKFTIETFPFSAKQNGYFSNPEIKLEAEVKGRRLSDVDVPEVNSVSAPLVARVISESGVKGKILSNTGPIQNTGDLPPVNEKTTTYTVELNALNRSNKLENAKLVFVLPPYVEYTGKISPESENINYNKDSREITWNIGSLNEDIGFGRNSRIVYIQLALTPPINLIGQRPNITSPLIFTAKDTFTSTEIKTTSGSLILEDSIK